MLYFAYGSNLSTCRLLQRVSTAELVTTGQLHHHQLLFHKIGRDGSAKCNAFYTGLEKDIIHGAVYTFDPDERTLLDDAEGLGNGYEIKDVSIVVNGSQHIQAFTYFATRIALDIKPFDWYREHVLVGAREHFFPDHYIDMITSVHVVEDTDSQRAKKELSVYSQKL